MSDLRETSIDFITGENFCTVYTSDNRYMNKLYTTKEEHPKEVKLKEYKEKDEVTALQATVPKKWFRFVHPNITRNLTEEQKQAGAERLRKARENKNNS